MELSRPAKPARRASQFSNTDQNSDPALPIDVKNGPSQDNIGQPFSEEPSGSQLALHRNDELPLQKDAEIGKPEAQISKEAIERPKTGEPKEDPDPKLAVPDNADRNSKGSRAKLKRRHKKPAEVTRLEGKGTDSKKVLKVTAKSSSLPNLRPPSPCKKVEMEVPRVKLTPSRFRTLSSYYNAPAPTLPANLNFVPEKKRERVPLETDWKTLTQLIECPARVKVKSPMLDLELLRKQKKPARKYARQPAVEIFEPLPGTVFDPALPFEPKPITAGRRAFQPYVAPPVAVLKPLVVEKPFGPHAVQLTVFHAPRSQPKYSSGEESLTPSVSTASTVIATVQVQPRQGPLQSILKSVGRAGPGPRSGHHVSFDERPQMIESQPRVPPPRLNLIRRASGWISSKARGLKDWVTSRLPGRRSRTGRILDFDEPDPPSYFGRPWTVTGIGPTRGPGIFHNRIRPLQIDPEPSLL